MGEETGKTEKNMGGKDRKKRGRQENWKNMEDGKRQEDRKRQEKIWETGKNRKKGRKIDRKSQEKIWEIG